MAAVSLWVRGRALWVDALVNDTCYMFTCHVHRHDEGRLWCSLIYMNTTCFWLSNLPCLYHFNCEVLTATYTSGRKSKHRHSLLPLRELSQYSSDLGLRQRCLHPRIWTCAVCSFMVRKLHVFHQRRDCG